MKLISVLDVPTDDRGIASFEVPADTYVMTGDRVYAEPGDHIHGYRDKAGVSYSVYSGGDCPHPATEERDVAVINAPSASGLLRHTGA